MLPEHFRSLFSANRLCGTLLTILRSPGCDSRKEVGNEFSYLSSDASSHGALILVITQRTILKVPTCNPMTERSGVLVHGIASVLTENDSVSLDVSVALHLHGGMQGCIVH